MISTSFRRLILTAAAVGGRLSPACHFLVSPHPLRVGPGTVEFLVKIGKGSDLDAYVSVMKNMRCVLNTTGCYDKLLERGVFQKVSEIRPAIPGKASKWYVIRDFHVRDSKGRSVPQVLMELQDSFGKQDLRKSENREQFVSEMRENLRGILSIQKEVSMARWTAEESLGWHKESGKEMTSLAKDIVNPTLRSLLCTQSPGGHPCIDKIWGLDIMDDNLLVTNFFADETASRIQTSRRFTVNTVSEVWAGLTTDALHSTVPWEKVGLCWSASTVDMTP